MLINRLTFQPILWMWMSKLTEQRGQWWQNIWQTGWTIKIGGTTPLISKTMFSGRPLMNSSWTGVRVHWNNASEWYQQYTQSLSNYSLA